MNKLSRSSFWNRYTYALSNYGIKPKQIRWHIMHAEQYLKTLALSSLTEHTPAGLESYLTQRLRTDALAKHSRYLFGNYYCSFNYYL